MVKKRFIRISSFLLLLLLLFPTILLSFTVAVTAETEDGVDGYYEDLNQTDILVDLQKYGVNTSEYAIDKTVKPGSDQDYLSIVRLVEFGYDYKQTLDNYGLFVYIYNPTCMDLTQSTWNRVQIALKKSGNIETSILKPKLIHIDHTDDHLLYKYRVDGLSKELLRSMAPAKRTYIISGVEFKMADWVDPHDYQVSGEYTFTGFLKGYGINKWDAETLFCSVEQFLTIKTELHMTNWRSDRSDVGENYYKDVAGVYFSVPNWILNKYGDEENPLKGLYEVEGEYEEYKLNGLVTTNEDTYDYVSHYECQSFADGISSSNVILSFWTGGVEPIGGIGSYYWLERYYNIDTPNTSYDEFGTRLNKLGVVFHDEECEAVDDVKAIMSRKILDRIEVLQSYGEDPYMFTVDDGHTKGYNTYKITAGQKETLANVDMSSKEGDKYWRWFWADSHYAQDVTVPALQLVDFGFCDWKAYFEKESEIADEYFMEEKYVEDFANYVAEKSQVVDITGSSVFMMHYSTTDTYIAPVYIHRAYDKISTWDAPGDHYYFEQSVFQNFDILSITMKDKYGNTTKIPVVADPKDFTPDLPSVGAVLRPGSKDPIDEINKDPSWWDKLNTLGKVLVVVGGLLAVALVLGLLKPVLKPIGTLLGAVFDGIGAVFRGGTKLVGNLFTAREKSYDAKRKRTEDRQADEDRTDKRRRDDYAEKRRVTVDAQEDEKYYNAKRRAAKQEARDDRRFESEAKSLNYQDRALDKKRKVQEAEDVKDREADELYQAAVQASQREYEKKWGKKK